MIGGFKGRYALLWNFYPCEVVFDGQACTSVEHAFLVAKVLAPLQREAIRVAPRQARTLGRHVRLRKDWGQVQFQIMEDLLLKKFADPRLKPRLLSTGEQYLAEINWWGVTFWGICNGRGLNQLGKLSMKVRSRLRSERSGEDRWSIDVGAMATFFLQRSRTRRRKSEQMGSRSAGADL